MEIVSTKAQILAAEDQTFSALGELPGPQGSTLMQRAAAGLAAVVARELKRIVGGCYGATVLVLVGAGNNGGDALWAAARLARRGVSIRLTRTGDRTHPGGWAAAVAAGARAVDPAAAQALLSEDRIDLVIDGILGIGGRAGLDGDAAALAAACAGTPVVAVDLPSGLDPDRPARPETAIRADVTVTFGSLRPCHVMQPAAQACGRVEVVDIGINPEHTHQRWAAADLAGIWPTPGPTSDKYSRGVVGFDTGSRHYPGAAVLGVAGAIHAGAGMVRHTGAAGEAVVARFPNVVRKPGRVQALVIGSGWGDRADAAEVVGGAVASGLPTVLDADALAALSGWVGERGLLTPHAGELARLLQTSRPAVEADPVGAATEAARRTGATVLLKGATQYVVAPDRSPVGIAVPGPAWTGQAGSGDVLAGICGALLGAGLSPYEAAMAGASVQALAAAATPGPHPPQTVAETVADVVAELTGGLTVGTDRLRWARTGRSGA